MPYGYTFFDSIIVIIASLLALYAALKVPGRLMLFLPAMLSVYVFIPFLTLLRLSDIVSIILFGVIVIQGKFFFPGGVKQSIQILLLIFALELIASIIIGDTVFLRIIIRTMSYVGLLGLFLFSWQECQNKNNYELLIRGVAIIALIHATYGVYQIVASKTGLPFRGIVRDIYHVQVAYEGDLLRINGLADEPKRLGYLLAAGSFAFFELARQLSNTQRAMLLRLFGIGVFGVSVLTFSGSYFLAAGFAGGLIMLLRPPNMKFLAVIASLIICFGIVFAGSVSQLVNSVLTGFERRVDEVELGLDGKVVYRQEFFAQQFLEQNPITIITGVGIGRSNKALNTAFGDGAGLDDIYLLPLNSGFFQLIFDMGIVGTLLIYSALLVIIIRAWRQKEIFIVQILVLLGIQSFTIIVMQYLVVFMGAALARISADKKAY